MNFDWKAFHAGAARALWTDTYIARLEEAIEDGAITREAARHAGLIPGPGGKWDDLIPKPGGSALLAVALDARRFTDAVRRAATATHLEQFEDAEISADEIGWYAMMGGLGHGVGLWDYDITLRVPHVEASSEVFNAADFAANRAITRAR